MRFVRIQLTTVTRIYSKISILLGHDRFRKMQNARFLKFPLIITRVLITLSESWHWGSKYLSLDIRQDDFYSDG